ncbi:MAG: methyltransferase domain-containing protein, partial [Lentisphaeria bacterium]|nr:methyltransferase domain-containing protein [Lentisphaeria bacterium]
MPTDSPLTPSPERYVPGTSRVTGLESEHRYTAAASLCRNKVVLDVASGEGYGSRILSQTARHVTGVDLNEEAVAHATRQYGSRRLDFVCADALSLPFEDGSFDVVVSFESIEHLPSPETFVQELHRVLKPRGLLILSSPNKTPFDFYQSTRKESNHYHINELEEEECVELLRRSFAHISIHRQNSFFNSIILGDERRVYLVRNDQNDLLCQQDLVNTQYVFLLATNGKLPTLPTSFYLDARYRENSGYWEDDEAVLNQYGLRGEYARLCQQNESAGQELAECRRTAEIALEKATAEHRLQIKKSEAEREQLQQKYQALLRQKTAAETHLAALQPVMEQLNRDLQESARRSERWLAEKTAFETRLQQARSEQNRLAEENRQLHQACQQLNTKLAKLETRCEYADMQSNTFRTELENTRNELFRKITHITKIESELEMAKRQSADLSSRLRSANDEKTRLAAECAVLKQTVDTLQNQLAAQKAELDRKENDRQNELQQIEQRDVRIAAMQQLLQEQSAVLATRTVEISNLHQECDKLNHTIADRDRELNVRQASLDRLSQRIQDQDQMLGRVVTDADVIKNENAQLRQSLANLSGDIASLHWSFENYRNRPSAKLFDLPATSARAVSGSLSRTTYSLVHHMAKHLPVSQVKRRNLAETCNRKLGWAFRNIDAYKEWQRIDELKKTLTRNNEDTGLIVPDDVPLTTVIIPVYNNLKLTRTCLTSIYSIDTKVPFEVLIVDDCSTQNIASLQKEFPGLRIVRNEKNLGFLRT